MVLVVITVELVIVLDVITVIGRSVGSRVEGVAALIPKLPAGVPVSKARTQDVGAAVRDPGSTSRKVTVGAAHVVGRRAAVRVVARIRMVHIEPFCGRLSRRSGGRWRGWRVRELLTVVR